MLQTVETLKILKHSDIEIQKLREELKIKYNKSKFIEPILDIKCATDDLSEPVHVDIYNHYVKSRKCFWTDDEIKCDNERKDFEKLEPDLQFLIRNILEFFSKADELVVDNMVNNFKNEIQYIELQVLYDWQVSIENIHTITYKKILKEIVTDHDELNKIKNNIYDNPCIIEKQQWHLKWADSHESFAQRNIANACTEGIFFCSSFCAIFWLQKFNVMPDFIKSNQFISKDENSHTETACIINNNHIVKKVDEKIVHSMVKEATELEKKFARSLFKKKFEGFNADLMCKYVEFVADSLLTRLRYNIIYGTSNPFPFMENMNYDNKTNFFESIPTNYQLVTSDGFKCNEDF